MRRYGLWDKGQGLIAHKLVAVVTKRVALSLRLGLKLSEQFSERRIVLMTEHPTENRREFA